MYQAHFGLKKPLFDSGIAQDASVFLAHKHDEIAANCKLALTTSDSAVVLTGPAGVGKTTLMSAVLRTTSTRLALGWITVAPANAAELLELLLVELGFNAHRVGRVERVQMWRQFLNESNATSSRVYVIAERADELSPETLRAFDSLTAADPNGSLGANLVLLGQPALLEVLKSPLLESLRQRIRLRQRLEPLTAEELRAYLEHHANLAGSQVDKLFTRNAVAALYELSGGVPRLANNLCETALTLAATRNERLVAAELLRHVAATMFGIEPPPTARTSSASAAASERPAARAQTEEKPAAAVERATAEQKSSPPAPSSPAEAKPVPVAAERAAERAETLATREAVAPAPAPRPVEPVAVKPATEPAAARPVVEPPVRSSAAPPPVAPTSAPAQASPVPASTPRAPTPAAPTASVSVAAADRPAVEAQVAAEPIPATATAAPARAATPKTYPSGPPDPDLDAFADTLTDSPDVPMLDFPVLTDAVEPARARPRADTAYVRPAAPQPPAAAAAKPAVPLPRVVAAASTPTPAPRAAKPAPAPTPMAAPPVRQPVAAKPTPPAARPAPPAQAEDDDVLRQTQTMRGLMAAKSIDDISDSMAETLFGEADLDMLSAALAASGWTDDDAAETVAASPPAAAKPAAPASATTAARPATAASPPVAAARPAGPASPPVNAARPSPPNAPASGAKPAAPSKALAPPPAEEDPFDFLGLGPDAPLELIEDSEPAPEPAPAQRKEATRNR
ncbi:MAG TPA: AAA family ATPase [Gammaproteobacteria bacterium]|nr:AAA family ATPase [Gammaproteobacteria bacterium]